MHAWAAATAFAKTIMRGIRVEITTSDDSVTRSCKRANSSLNDVLQYHYINGDLFGSICVILYKRFAGAGCDWRGCDSALPPVVSTKYNLWDCW